MCLKYALRTSHRDFSKNTLNCHYIMSLILSLYNFQSLNKLPAISYNKSEERLQMNKRLYLHKSAFPAID